MKLGDLKKRWAEDALGAHVIALLERAQTAVFDAAPFGSIAGRIDLRGLAIPPQTHLKGVKARDLDLTSAILAGVRLEGCSFENVSFDECVAGKLADLGNKFVDCSFVRTNFKGAALGYRGSHFVRTAFVEADFRQGIFIRPEFDEATFDRCRYEGIDFNGASFRKCIFAGEVREVWFRGGFALPDDQAQFGTPRPNTMEAVSFENARLFDVTFSDGCDLRTVQLPLDGTCRRFEFWKERLEKLLVFAASQPASERKEIEIFCRAHLVHAPWQDTYILSMNDLRMEHGEKLARMIMDNLAGA